MRCPVCGKSWCGDEHEPREYDLVGLEDGVEGEIADHSEVLEVSEHGVVLVPVKPRFDRVAYMREYNRKKAEEKRKAKECKSPA